MFYSILYHFMKCSRLSQSINFDEFYFMNVDLNEIQPVNISILN